MDTATNPVWDWLEAPTPHHRVIAAQDCWEGRTIADLAIELEGADPLRELYIEDGKTFTAKDVLADARALASALHRRGLKHGDVVSFQMPNWIEAAVINLAAALSGLVVNPIVPIYRDAEVGMMLADCRAKALFVCGQFRNFDFSAMARRLQPGLPDLEHVFVVRGDGAQSYEVLVEEGRNTGFDPSRVESGAVKLLLYTSGTTGRPKAVLHSHDTLLRVMRESIRHWSIRSGDSIIMPSPVTHISGYSNGLELPWIVGTRTILMESWNADAALELIDRYQVSGTVAATPFLVELASTARAVGKRLPSLRFFACGGAAVPPDLIPAANSAFENCQAFRVFGSSEVPLVTLGYPASLDERLAATTDGAIIDYEVRIVDDGGHDMQAGEDGEILARGPSMFLGYADRLQTMEAITSDGWFRTGDIGRLTPEGALLITARKKDLIIRGGENISAKEIEDVLHTHLAVEEASVVAMPHPRLGEGVCAFVIFKPGHEVEASDLARHVSASGLARQKIPERFEFVENFPRTASGKIRKDLLRAHARKTAR